MRNMIICLILAAWGFAQGMESSNTISIVNKKSGEETLADFQVDTAPGSIAASSMLSVSADAIKEVQNPRDLSILLQAFDSNKTFGLSVTPARTSLVSMPLATYINSDVAKFLSSTTLGYAQTTATVNDRDYEERAWSIEASAYLGDDDPLQAWANALSRADKHDDAQACGAFAGPALPSGQPGQVAAAPVASPVATPVQPISPVLLPNDNAVVQEVAARRARCQAYLAKKARWNTSRIWASFVSGTFRGTAPGSQSHGLGRALILGGSWGLGDNASSSQVQITGGLRRGLKQPVLSTYADPSPQTKNSTLSTLRIAYGRTELRALLEASNIRDEAPNASEHTFKRALGLDVRVAKGMWLNFRLGRQRKIDNSGDETGSAILLNISPSSLISFSP